MKRTKLIAAALTGAVMPMLALPVAASDEIGKEQYDQNCAACHGATGTGNGDLSELMTVKVPDLTGIKAANDGVFPTLKIIHIVDGRSGVRGHGYPMPVWGDHYKSALGDIGDYAAEIEVRGRILSLVYYLDSLQK